MIPLVKKPRRVFKSLCSKRRNRPRLAGTMRASIAADELLDPADDSVIEHHLNSVGMIRRLRQDSLNNSFRQLSCPLILLFNNTHFHANLNIRSRLAIHCLIITQGKTRPLCGFLEVRLRGAAVRAGPRVWNVLPSCSRRQVRFRISGFLVISVAANDAGIFSIRLHAGCAFL